MISSTSAVLRFAVQRLMSSSITILMSSSFQNYDLSSFLVGHYTRLDSSITFNVLKALRRYRASCMKSNDQIWFGIVGAMSGCLGNLGSRFRVRLGMLSFISL